MNFQTKSIITTILIIGSIIIGYFVLWPKWNEYSAVRVTLVTSKDKTEQLKTAQNQLNSFLDEFRTHKTEAEQINSALPLNRDEMYNILNNLEVSAGESGVTLGSLGVDDDQTNDQLGAQPNTVQQVSVSLNGAGSYLGIKNFIIKLEKNLRIIDISTLTIQADSSSDKTTYNLKFKTYYQK